MSRRLSEIFLKIEQRNSRRFFITSVEFVLSDGDRLQSVGIAYTFSSVHSKLIFVPLLLPRFQHVNTELFVYVDFLQPSRRLNWHRSSCLLK